jgi:hypothetical protein
MIFISLMADVSMLVVTSRTASAELLPDNGPLEIFKIPTVALHVMEQYCSEPKSVSETKLRSVLFNLVPET